jgi:hypothetical protein
MCVQVWDAGWEVHIFSGLVGCKQVTRSRAGLGLKCSRVRGFILPVMRCEFDCRYGCEVSAFVVIDVHLAFIHQDLKAGV